jgi:four helix bundle protein
MINSKFQAPNSKQIPMTKIQNAKQYDLEERSFQFAKDIALFVNQLSRTITNLEYGRQLVDASGSVGANYIEANESLGKKDFMMRIKICRKEAKESSYWLRLIIETNGDHLREEGLKLLGEATELRKIFSSILAKSK